MTSSTSLNSSSSGSSHDHFFPASRSPSHASATVIPTLPALESARSSTSHEPSFASGSFAARRRSGTTQAQLPSLHLDLASTAARCTVQSTLHSVPEPVSEEPSAPIPIPARKKEQGSPPITPLTARVRNPFLLDLQFASSNPSRSRSLTPCYSVKSGKLPYNLSNTHAQRGFSPMPPRPGSPLNTPTSALLPTLPAQHSSSGNRQRAHRSAGGADLDLSALPRFHPAKFATKDSSTAPSSSRSSHSATSQSCSTRGCDAQAKLQKYQHGLLANAAKSSRSLLSEGVNIKPTPPRLAPVRSPKDPMTPLLLEGQGDYILAGACSLPIKLQGRDGREMVEQFVRRENERRNHPEARSAASGSPVFSPAISPAVSPAGGCR